MNGTITASTVMVETERISALWDKYQSKRLNETEEHELRQLCASPKAKNFLFQYVYRKNGGMASSLSQKLEHQ